jgi:hypothetical protein
MFFSASSIKEYFTEIKVPYDSEFLIGQFLGPKGSRNITLYLVEVYQDHPLRPLQTNSIAKWTPSGGFIWSRLPSVNRRAELHDVTIRVGVPGEVSVTRFIILLKPALHLLFVFLTCSLIPC